MQLNTKLVYFKVLKSQLSQNNIKFFNPKIDMCDKSFQFEGWDKFDLIKLKNK